MREMDAKQRLSHRQYIEILRRMTPEQRLRRAFRLSDCGKREFLRKLRDEHPGASEEEFRRVLRDRLLQVSEEKSRIGRSLNQRGLNKS
jgi:DNA-binding PadR family transcriptional regulator